MTRTSKALKRLGVASVAIATIGAGVPAFFAVSASAAQTFPTGITISPKQETGQLGTCNPFTVTVSPTPAAGDTASVDVTISQAVAAQDANQNTTPGSTANNFAISGQNAAVQIGFCTPTAANSGPNPQPANADQPPNTNSTAVNGGPNPINNTRDAAGNPQPVQNGTPTVTCTGTRPGNTNPNQGTVPNNQSGSAVCNADFVLNGSTPATANSSTFTFGIFSNYAGQLPVTSYIDLNDDDVPQSQAEPTDTAQKTFVSSSNNVAAKVACQPRTSNQAANSVKQFTCTATNSANQPVAGVTVGATISSGPDRGLTITCGQPNTPPTTQNPNPPVTQSGTTNGQGQATCQYTNNGGLGTDTINVFVNGSSTAADQITATFFGTARNINCLPKTSTVAPGGGQVINCTVTDLNGNPVANQGVQFTLSGPGRLNGAQSTVQATTDGSGVATVTVSTFNNEQGTSTVTATLGTYNANTNTFTPAANANGNTAECQQAKGTTVAPGGSNTNATTAGNCSDSAVVTFATPSPSPSASTTVSASPTATGSPSNATGGRGTLETSTPDIQPNVQGVLNASNLTGGAAYELRCYSRPSTSYFTARRASVATGNSTLEFRILPGTNTRCYVRPAGNDAAASNTVVINVHTTLSLSTVFRGGRTYTFQGRNLPRRSGQLITLYRVANGQEIRTSNLTTDASGIYRLDRTFTGRGTFDFLVRTSQTLTNAPGKSNIISVTIR